LKTVLKASWGTAEKGDTGMDPKDKAREWADEIPDEEEQEPAEYEQTYRDGSAKNECWGEN